MPSLPSGTVTFLFSDVEGSTQLLERYPEATGIALARHHDLFEEVVARHDGAIFETVGDAVYAAFSQPRDAVTAALEVQQGLRSEDWGEVGRLAVRIAIHSGPVERRGDHYFGPALFRCARLQALGYGEQTLLSAVTAQMVAAALPPGATLRDLGQHRLKDLGEPEQVFQLNHPDLRAEFPSLKSLDSHPNNLPLELSTFVGRDAEIASVSELLQGHRLVTLTGPGGIGKTRLALQVAAERFERYTDGVFLVDLAAVREPALVTLKIATTLGLREEPATPLATALHDHCRGKELLLVLDNFEHLLAAAPAVADLLSVAPALRVLVTSRAPLHIRGERTYSVPPLTSDADGSIPGSNAAAVQMFVDRAVAVRPDLAADSIDIELVSEICRRLDGLPLAIELAAARLRVLNLVSLRDRLAHRLPLLNSGDLDAPQRQQALRATIAWSEDLLSDSERQLFRQMSAFPAGSTLEGIEAVSTGPLDVDVLDGLSRLVDHSLVRGVALSDEPRYVMLETIREYALERLEADGDLEAIRERVANYLMALSERIEPALVAGGQASALGHFDEEIDNFRDALAWLQHRGDGVRLAKLSTALTRYWMRRGLPTEGRRWLSSARQLLTKPDPLAIAWLSRSEGALATDQGQLLEAVSLLREAADLFRSQGKDDSLAETLGGIANAEQMRGNFAAGIEAGTEAQALAQRIGNLRAEASATGNLALIALRQERLDDAEKGLRRATDLFRTTGDHRAVVIGLGNLASVAMKRGHTDRAKNSYEEAISAARELGDLPLEGWGLANLAEILAVSGDLDLAAAALVEGLTKLMKAEDAVAVADTLDTAGFLLSRQERWADAAFAWGASDAAHQRMAIPLTSNTETRSLIDTARMSLGTAEFDRCRRVGSEMGHEDAAQKLIDALQPVPPSPTAAGMA
jgi:predicted ATPase/class 3 adenylate cyclase